MSEGPQCLGICMFDWDAGVCLGCGRTAEQIDGSTPEAPAPEPAPPADAGKADEPSAARTAEGEGGCST